MYPVTFTFRATTPAAEQQSLLRAIDDWSEVVKTGRVDPGATDDEDRLACYAYVKDPQHLAPVADRIARIPAIERSSVPSERRLIW